MRRKSLVFVPGSMLKTWRSVPLGTFDWSGALVLVTPFVLQKLVERSLAAWPTTVRFASFVRTIALIEIKLDVTVSLIAMPSAIGSLAPPMA